MKNFLIQSSSIIEKFSTEVSTEELKPVVIEKHVSEERAE